MAFNFLRQLVQTSRATDLSSPVDDFEDDMNESDVEMEADDDFSERYEDELDDRPARSSSENESDGELNDVVEGNGARSCNGTGDFDWSSELKPVEIELFPHASGPNSTAFDLNYESDPIDFFHLFFPASLISTITEQSNIYARICFQCREKDVRTQSHKRPETVFGCALCNTHLCNELCFAQFHEKLSQQ